MSLRVISDPEYKNWIGQLSNRYRAAQIKAAVAVNSEMLHFYWELGRDIVDMQSGNKYGSKFFETLSHDLKEALPEAKGFSVKNLYYIRRFYLMYSNLFPHLEGKFPEVMGNLANKNLPHPVANFPHLGGNSENAIWHQLGADLFSIPWWHHLLFSCRLSILI